ncbi:hypothetical protein LOZ58_003945 [Ophidiomyces ophidiicola]|nr:hypothetical protein LOZ58_003945 [Ophidiomyces ophidiicola]
MPKRISREERARRAKRAEFDPEKTGVSGKQVFRALEPGVEKGYNNMWEVWQQPKPYWNDAAVEGIEVDPLENFMSVTLLHEFLHGIDGDQFLWHTPALFGSKVLPFVDVPFAVPAELAPGVPEAYGVIHDIKTLTSAQKMKNADSYALLAGGLYYWLRPLEKNGDFQRPYEKGREPPKGPHPEDSVLWIRNSDDEEDSDADFNANRRARTKAETIAHSKPDMSNIIQV